MYSNIPNESKLTAFVPVNVPKPRDIFRRRGFLSTTDTMESSNFDRNPLSDFDNNTRKMTQYHYEKYRESVENSSTQVEQKDNDDLPEDDKK